MISTINCGGLSKTDARKIPTNAQERARKNVDEGKGISIKGVMGGIGGGGSFQFSTSNPMWRASLEILDFLPLATVDYSGGIIITDWYSDSNLTEDAIKITVRFLSNEIKSNSVKVIVHKKTCVKQDCRVSLLDSKIKGELLASILKKATVYESEKKK